VGATDIRLSVAGTQHRAHTAALLRDLEALDRMVGSGMLEDGPGRIGAEQEVVLVDHDWRPSPRGLEVLGDLRDRAGDTRITNEVARFNLEANIAPIPVGAGMLAAMEAEVADCLAAIGRAAAAHECRPVLAGIVPSIELRDLGPLNLCPFERYAALDRAVREMRGRDFEASIKGTDELTVRFPSIMLEAVNTSFQVHLQIGAEHFVPMYNLAQLLAGPVLAACANSPLLFGRRLWRETRIAIFQQTIDTRRSSGTHREEAARVRFGDAWIRSITEIFRSDIARFRLLFGYDEPEDSLAVLGGGGVPALAALALHNGTVYRWNRPCYGVTEGRPHLRIENRYLPAGPTVVDEIANAALWLGAMLGGREAFGEITRRVAFDDAATNFLRAARQGLDTRLAWLDGSVLGAPELILEHVLPAARAGLSRAGLPDSEIDRYLGVISARVGGGQTGAEWQLRSFEAITPRLRRGRSAAALTAAMCRLADTGAPVHTWPLANVDECAQECCGFCRVSQFMSTNLFTVAEDELVELVARIMDWEEIRHVLVEDSEHRLVGVISWRQILRHLSEAGRQAGAAASDIMQPAPITGSPEMSAAGAIALMQEHRVSALPIVEEGRLVGIVTERDFTRIAGELLEDRLGARRPRA
jgi:CBS domain-containing protein